MPAACKDVDLAWSKIYLATRLQRDLAAAALADTSAAIAVVRCEQPAKLEQAYRQGKMAGVKRGLFFGAGGLFALFFLIKAAL